MPGCLIISEKKDPDLGLYAFSFLYNNKPYTVEPKPREPDEDYRVGNYRYSKLNDFLKYVKFVCKKPNVNPFQYKDWQKNFIIRPAGTGTKKPIDKSPEPEQMSLFASIRALDKVASILENKGRIKEAYEIDMVSNTLQERANTTTKVE